MSSDSGVEVLTGHADEVAEAREEVKAKVREINAQQEGIKELERRRLETELVDELGQRTTAATEVQIDGVEVHRPEAIEVKRTVAKVLEAVAQGVIQPADPKAKRLLVEIGNRGVTNTTASYFQNLIQRYIDEPILFSSNGGEKTRFEKDLAILQRSNPAVYAIVTDVLQSSPEEFGLTPEQSEKPEPG